MTDYRTAKLYMSLVEFPNPGPNPPGSGRYQHAVEICRVFASKPLYERNDVRGAEEAMCLFLAGWYLEERNIILWNQGGFKRLFRSIFLSIPGLRRRIYWEFGCRIVLVCRWSRRRIFLGPFWLLLVFKVLKPQLSQYDEVQLR